MPKSSTNVILLVALYLVSVLAAAFLGVFAGFQGNMTAMRSAARDDRSVLPPSPFEDWANMATFQGIFGDRARFFGSGGGGFSGGPDRTTGKFEYELETGGTNVKEFVDALADEIHNRIEKAGWQQWGEVQRPSQDNNDRFAFEHFYSHGAARGYMVAWFVGRGENKYALFVSVHEVR